MLSESLKEWINKKVVELIQLTPEYGSIGSVVTQTVDLKITGLPYNLNSVPTIELIEFVLSPFASVKTHTVL
jgi:hypothetical protein